jgi:hypothetical protein
MRVRHTHPSLWLRALGAAGGLSALELSARGAHEGPPARCGGVRCPVQPMPVGGVRYSHRERCPVEGEGGRRLTRSPIGERARVIAATEELHRCASTSTVAGRKKRSSVRLDARSCAVGGMLLRNLSGNDTRGDAVMCQYCDRWFAGANHQSGRPKLVRASEIDSEYAPFVSTSRGKLSTKREVGTFQPRDAGDRGGEPACDRRWARPRLHVGNSGRLDTSEVYGTLLNDEDGRHFMVVLFGAPSSDRWRLTIRRLMLNLRSRSPVRIQEHAQ